MLIVAQARSFFISLDASPPASALIPYRERIFSLTTLENEDGDQVTPGFTLRLLCSNAAAPPAAPSLSPKSLAVALPSSLLPGAGLLRTRHQQSSTIGCFVECGCARVGGCDGGYFAPGEGLRVRGGRVQRCTPRDCFAATLSPPTAHYLVFLRKKPVLLRAGW